MLKSRIVMEFDSIEAYHQFLAAVTKKGAHMSEQTPRAAALPADEEGRPVDGSTEVAPVTPDPDLVPDNVQPSEPTTEPTTATEE